MLFLIPNTPFFTFAIFVGLIWGIIDIIVKKHKAKKRALAKQQAQEAQKQLQAQAQPQAEPPKITISEVKAKIKETTALLREGKYGELTPEKEKELAKINSLIDNVPLGRTETLTLISEDDNVTVFESTLNGIVYTCITTANPRNFKPGDTLTAKAKLSGDTYTMVCQPNGNWAVEGLTAADGTVFDIETLMSKI